jgi:hypothetical protein
MVWALPPGLHNLEYVTAAEVHFSTLQPHVHGLLHCLIISMVSFPPQSYKGMIRWQSEGTNSVFREDGAALPSQTFQLSLMSDAQHEGMHYHVEE